MGLLRNHTRLRLEPLNVQAGDNPTFTLGSTQQFSLATLPDDDGQGYAYYLLALVLSISGLFTGNGTAGTSLYRDELPRMLIASVAVQGAWHGTPISSGNYFGQYCDLLEYVMCGYQHLQRARGYITGSTTTNNFNVRLVFPLSVGLGEKSHHTAQLALLYKNAQFVVNAAPATTLSTFNAHLSLSAMSCRASALLLGQSELLMGPVIEVVDYNTPAPSSGTSLDFLEFGRTTGISNTEKEAGTIFAMLMSNVNGMGGAFDPGNGVLTRLGVPFTDQPDTNDIGAYFDMQMAAMGNSRVIGSVNPSGAIPTAAGLVNDYSGFPFRLGADYGASGDTDPLPAGIALGVPIVTPGEDMELSKLRVPQQNNIRINATISSQTGTHHLLAVHARRYTDNGQELWREKVIQSGLARKVLGDVSNTDQYGWELKTKNKQADPGIIDPGKMRFLPRRLVNTTDQRRVVL